MKKEYLKPDIDHVIFYTEEHITDEEQEGNAGLSSDIQEVTKPTGWN